MPNLRSCVSRLCSLAFLAGPAHAAPSLPPPQIAQFAHVTSDLKPDPAVRYGTLPNGLRYALLRNAEPKNRASLHLQVAAGSFHETEAQRGVAHFLEHMAFNGSMKFPPGSLLEVLQRLGMGFGNDLNAFTSFDRTVYKLELPKTDPATLDQGLRVFTDYAGGLLLRNDEIDKERGIIISEKRDRDTIGFRTRVAAWEFNLPATLIPKRIPIGLTSVIEGAPRERFVEFYNTWYRPEKITVIAVGDFDVDAFEKQLVDAFSPFVARAPVRPEPDRGTVAATSGLRTYYHPEVEAPATAVAIMTLTPQGFEADTVANRLKDLPRTLANAIISRRLSTLAKKENAPFSSGSTSVDDNFDVFREAYIELTCKADQWSAALAVADQELRRALAHGFSVAELREVTATFINSVEQSVKAAATRRSGSLATALASAINGENVFTHPSVDLDLYRPALEKITPADCLAALRAAWASTGRIVSVTGNAKISVAEAPALLAAAYEKSAAVPVAAPAAEAEAVWAYTDFGAPGTITARTTVEDLGITLVTFANGVRVNLKPTPFEASRIILSARIGDGILTQPLTQPGLTTYANMTLNAGGLGRHSTDDLRRLLAGKTAGAALNVAGDALVVTGTTNPADLLLQLQLMAAKITDPGYRAEAARQAEKSLEQTYLQFARVPSGPLSLEFGRLLANGDVRFGLPPKAIMDQRTVAEVRTWLAPQLATGAIELAVVGDFKLEPTLAAIAQTFGALPTRSPKPDLAAQRKVTMPAEPLTKSYTVETDIPKGLIGLYWPSTDAMDFKRTQRLSMLAKVLSDRLRVKVREELGGAYSPTAGSSLSDVYPGYGFFVAQVSVDPAKAQEIADVVVALAADLAEKGVTAEELERSKQPVLTSSRENIRTNGYWLGAVLSRAQEKPERLEWARTRIADIEAITAEELSALAKQYLPAARVSRVTVLPAPKPGPKPTE
ncbi:MAG: peptidase M16 [Opitutia bacterium]|nr:MAG: peptidase M16 [Opitutae bacterium]